MTEMEIGQEMEKAKKQIRKWIDSERQKAEKRIGDKGRELDDDTDEIMGDKRYNEALKIYSDAMRVIGRVKEFEQKADQRE